MRMRHFQKYSTLIIVLGILFILAWGLDIEKYREHNTSDKRVISGEQIYLTDATIKRWPLSESWIIDMIDNAETRVWVAVYTFTLPNMREALLRAKERWVDVRVILEKFPFWNTGINRETQAFFEANAISFHLSGEKQFAFMHAKYAIIDDKWILETANWTRASFSSNREFFLVGTDDAIRDDIISLFENDFRWWIWTSKDIRLLAGPTNARERLLLYVGDGLRTVDIYAPSFSDAGMLTKLAKLCYEGKSIRILLAQYDTSEEQKPDYGTCIEVRKMKKSLHAKAIIRDKASAFVGSFNYTQNSLERNREVGLFISGEIAKSISESFEIDWKQSEVALR